MANRRFFIVGAPKAGTTSAYHYLKQNREIFLPEVKELHFFSYPEVTDTYYRVPIVATQTEYDRHFAAASRDQIIGDICPSYLYNPQAASRIFDYDREARIIILLRNPVDRALSHYFMDQRSGYQSTPLARILALPEAYPLYYKEYVAVGRYAEQVGRYVERFGRERVLILEFDEFVADVRKGLARMGRFVGLCTPFEYDLREVHNGYAVPRNRALTEFLSRSRVVGSLATYLPQGVKRMVRRGLYDTRQRKPDCQAEKALLLDLFRDDIAALQPMVDFDTGRWLRKYEQCVPGSLEVRAAG